MIASIAGRMLPARIGGSLRRKGDADTLSERRGKRQKVKVYKMGPVAAFVRPIGVMVAVLLAAYGLASLGSTFWRSYQRHQDYTTAAHQDRSLFGVFSRFTESDVPADAIDLVIREVDGDVRKVVAGKSETDAFVNDTILMLDTERVRIKMAAAAEIDRAFDYAFADREQAIEAYADWFFEWKRSYIVLKDTLASAAGSIVQAGEYESLSEAVERDLKDYFMRHYKAQVLKPELRDGKIASGLESAARSAHESYRRVIANSDMRLKLFLAQHTRHLCDIPADEKMTQARLDWDAQKWKAPVYLMEDRAFDGIAGLGTAAGGGTAGALVLGPVMQRAMARSFTMLSRRFATRFGARLSLAGRGAAAGTLVQPAGGQVAGAIAGVLVGIAADYLVNEAQESFNRETFVKANREALDATVAAWKDKVKANLDAAIDRWFDDARASVVLAER